MSSQGGLPEPSELFEFMASSMLAHRAGIEVNTAIAVDGKLEGYGQTAAGQEFAFSIPVTEFRIWRTDS